MDILVKCLIGAFFLLAIFGVGYVPDFLYWSAYPVMFVLVYFLWRVSYWVPREKCPGKIGGTPSFDVFCARVPEIETADLIRGRLCFIDGNIVLVQKFKKEFKVTWTLQASEVTSVAFGKVVGSRKGFVLITAERKYAFTSIKICKNIDLLYRALGWEMSNSAQTGK